MADKHGLFVDLEAEADGLIPEQMRFLLFDSVRELLFNVVKHSRTSSAAISVRRVNAHLQVTVSDQGVGFDPIAMTVAGAKGAGFGLFSIRERLELLGGDLKIHSAIDQGSRFTITLPHAPSEIIEPTSQQRLTLLELPLISQNGLESGPKIRILLADDHAVVRQGIENMLTNEPDMEVVGSAADGQEAVELTAKLLPDVILMDMSMPKLNGVEATRIIHNEYPEISIIGLSMFEEAERAQAMRDAGAVQYVMKSGAADMLLAAIRTYKRSQS
jgi:CheY-like chemotaxis protein